MAVEGIGLTTRDSNNRVALSSDTNYADTMIHLGYGFPVNEKLNVGGALKINFKGSSGAPETQGFGNNVDLGMVYQINEKLKSALVVRNAFWGIGPLGTVQNASGTTDTYKSYFSLGLGYQAWDNLYLESNLDLSFADYRYMLVHLGGEYKLSSFLYLRGGIDQQNNQIKQAVSTSISFGVGVNYDSFRFDYAYHPYGDVQNLNTHYFSLSLVGNEGVTDNEEPSENIKSPEVVPTPAQVILLTPVDRLVTYEKTVEVSGQRTGRNGY
jgi:hypothetical protein